MARYNEDYRDMYRGFPMHPMRRPDSMDPNHRGGEYRGVRMESGYEGQAAYGRHRYWHAGDLGGYGGFDGRYDAGPGWVDDDGVFRDPFDERGEGREGGVHHAYRPEDFPRGGGGVRYDMGYLRDFNAHSPVLRQGHGYDRNYGWAEGAPPRGERGSRPYDRDHFQRSANRYGGYNSGGFAQGTRPQQAPRGSHVDRV